MDKFDFEVNIPTFKDSSYLITDFGAVGDGRFDNKSVIQSTIDKCSSEGGGKVIIPRGIYFSGPIQLKSNVNLHLEDGAVLLFSPNFEDYPLINTNFEGFFTYRCISPIYTKEAENIAITGNGVIDGDGGAWRPVKKFKLSEKMWNELTEKSGVVLEGKDDIWWPSESAMNGHVNLIPNPEKLKDEKECSKYHDFLRPVLVNFTNCKNILLDGPTFKNSPAWCLHPWLCEHLTIRNITVKNPWYSQNGDGVDIDSCKYVQVMDSTFDVGDDAICIKSGKNEDGRKLGKPCEYVVFKNCIVYHGHGGFVVGSEMSGGVKNIKISDCTFIGTDTGLRFKSCLGRGGVVEDIYIDNINMTRITKEAIIFTMEYDMDTKEGQEVQKEEIPEFKNVYISNVNCVQAGTGISISGLSEMPIHDIEFKNVTINSKNPVKIEMAENIKQENVSVILEK